MDAHGRRTAPNAAVRKIGVEIDPLLGPRPAATLFSTLGILSPLDNSGSRRMDRDEKIAAAARRAAKLEVEATRRAAQAAVAEVSSSMCVENVAQMCESGYRKISHAAANVVAEIEGEDAPQHTGRLDEILREFQAQVLGIYQQHASRSGIKQRVENRRADVQRVLDEILKETVADLELGIAGGVNVRKRKSGVSIDNRGGSGQFIFDSPNALQVVGRDQASSGSIDRAALRDLLGQVREWQR